MKKLSVQTGLVALSLVMAMGGAFAAGPAKSATAPKAAAVAHAAQTKQVKVVSAKPSGNKIAMAKASTPAPKKAATVKVSHKLSTQKTASKSKPAAAASKSTPKKVAVAPKATTAAKKTH